MLLRMVYVFKCHPFLNPEFSPFFRPFQRVNLGPTQKVLRMRTDSFELRFWMGFESPAEAERARKERMRGPGGSISDARSEDPLALLYIFSVLEF